MEAVGRLAGRHCSPDFNNLLTVVGGYAHILLDGTPVEDPRHDKLKQRSWLLPISVRSTLTSQLRLAFGHRQLVQPKLVQVNNLLTNMETLLRRVMGEHINLQTELGSDLPCVKADPNQLEQVLINLAANARDAMPHGGEFRIRTTLVDGLGGADLGRVRIEIGDTGCGMGQDVLEHVFEPFFYHQGRRQKGHWTRPEYGVRHHSAESRHDSRQQKSRPGFDIRNPPSGSGWGGRG